MHRSWLPTLLLAVPFAWAAKPAAAASGEDAIPRVETDFAFELQADWTVDADDPESEIFEVFGKVGNATEIRFTDALSLRLGLVFESLDSPAGGSDRFFEGHGLILEQANLRYSTDRFAVYAGKFNSAFGIAWSETPGLYGDGFAKDYEYVEGVGFGGEVSFGSASDEGGACEHRLGAALFRSDRSFASDSLFYSRGRTRLSAGGPANTEGLSSVALTWHGEKLPGPDLEYHAALSLRAGGRGDPRDEIGLVAGFTGSRSLSDRLELEGVFELAHFWNAEAERADRLNATVGAVLSIDERWRTFAAFAIRDLRAEDRDADATDYLLEIGAGYRFESGLGIDAGFRSDRVSGEEASGLGLLVSWSKELSFP